MKTPTRIKHTPIGTYKLTYKGQEIWDDDGVDRFTCSWLVETPYETLGSRIYGYFSATYDGGISDFFERVKMDLTEAKVEECFA